MVVEVARGADMEEQFVQRMKLLREVQRISQGDLASRMVNAGWGYWRQSTVSRIEKFERTVRLAEAHDIAKILGLSLAEMLTVGEEVRNQNIEAAERRRDLNDWVGLLNGSVNSFMAQLEQFRSTLHQANTPQEGLMAPGVAKASPNLAPDPDSTALAAMQDVARAVDEYARPRKQDADDDPTRTEAHNGINPEA